MGIKLKNKYLYIICCIVGIYMFSFSLFAGYDLVINNQYLVKEPYFHSTKFQSEVNVFCNNLYYFYDRYKNYNEKDYESKISRQDINGLKLFYEDKLTNKQKEIKDKYEYDITQAEKTKDKDKAYKLTNEKNKELEDIVKENTKSNEEITKEIVLRYRTDYENIKKSLQSRKDIKYYITDIKTKQIYTNLDKKVNIDDYIKNQSKHTLKVPSYHATPLGVTEIGASIREASLEGYIIIPKNLDSDNYILKDYNHFNSIRDRLIKEAIMGLVALIGSIIILMVLKKDKNINVLFLEKIKGLYNRITLDLKILLFLMYTIFINYFLIHIHFFYKPITIHHFTNLTVVSIYIIYLIYNIKFIRKIRKNKSEFFIQAKNCIITKLVNLIMKRSKNMSIKFKLIMGVVFTLLLEGVLCIIFFEFTENSYLKGEALILFIGIMYIYLILRYIFKKVDYLNMMMQGTKEMSLGNLDYIIEEKGPGTLSKIAYNINNMKDGYKKSVEEKVKSERLKSELITNVSHDLKTPLTSIINYVNLLKKEDLSKDEIKAYISILDRKSERLKILIEDLFEASKMSSGVVELNIEKLDVAALLKQGIAEFDEKLKKSSLKLKFKHNDNKVYANLDGKKTWRVFENLINNIIKYSQPNTRVYIDLIEENSKVIIIMKNISSYEMDFSAEEIFERFKRGDKSRKTEGSGLGLAIAKSIVELEGGSLNIEIDGDLFKSIIEFQKL